MDLVIVAALAEDGTIGDDGTIPWHHPEDLAHFKETTYGSPVIMGRRTFESIVERLGGPLPGRVNVVLSHRDPADIAGADAVVEGTETAIVSSIDAAIETAAATGAEATYIAGGRTVYEQFLDRADVLLLTEIPGTYDGDTRFPAIHWPTWNETDRWAGDEVSFVRYERA